MPLIELWGEEVVAGGSGGGEKWWGGASMAGTPPPPISTRRPPPPFQLWQVNNLIDFSGPDRSVLRPLRNPSPV